MGQTPANARHHLTGLERDGLVHAVRRPSRSPGRPEKAFSLTATLRGNSLAALSELLLDDYLGAKSDLEQDDSLRRLAQRLGDFPPAPRTAALPRRLSALVERLSALHYEPRWEARAAGPQIVFGNCPFGQIIGRHPELCRLDAHLLEQGLVARVQQLAKLEPNQRGLPVCIFAVT